MNYLDIFLIIIIGWGAYNGFLKGLIQELASILGIIFGIYLAKNYYSFLDQKLYLLFESEANYLSLISAIIIFLLTIMIFKIVASFLTKFLKLIALGLLNKIIGAIFGVLKSLLILCVIIFVFSKINNVVNIIEKDKLQESFIYTEIERINKLIIEKNYTEKGSEE
tara:strand:- start:1273 stop:1770 length:498 start_codon:yes stop_codon:yes gene_type:complete